MRRIARCWPVRALAFASAIGVLALIAPGRAYAYLDPGTGSYVFQLALALVLGALFTGKVYWRKLQAFFRRLFGKEQ